MAQQPTVVEWLNGEDDALLAGSLVVGDTSGGNAVRADGAIPLTGPVGAVTGVPAAGVATGGPFEAILSGEAVVLMEDELPSLVPGQRLYVSPNTPGTATNVRPPGNVFPIGILRSLQATSGTTLAVMGAPTESESGSYSGIYDFLVDTQTIDSTTHITVLAGGDGAGYTLGNGAFNEQRKALVNGYGDPGVSIVATSGVTGKIITPGQVGTVTNIRITGAGSGVVLMWDSAETGWVLESAGLNVAFDFA